MRRTVIPYTRTVVEHVVRSSRSGYKSRVCTGNGSALAPSGTALDHPDPQPAEPPTVVLRLDHLLAAEQLDPAAGLEV
jgi:hypothetical protein